MLRPLLVLALLMLPACGSLQAPRTAIVGATLGDATEEAVEVDVLLELENPNAAPLRLEDVRYDVRVDGVTVSDMRRAPIATLESDGTRVLVLPGVIRYADLGWRIDDVPATFEISASGSITYLEPGTLREILFDSGVQRPSVSFSGAAIVDAAP